MKRSSERIVRGFVEALSWWIDGLWIGLPDAWRRRFFQPREQVIVRILDRRASIERYGDDSTPSAPGRQLELDAQGEDVTVELSGCDITVVVEDAVWLRKRFVLPIAAEGELDRVLRHELDRLLPFDVDDMVFDWRVLARNSPPGKLQVEAVLIPRHALNAILASLERAKMFPKAVTASDPAGQPLPINWLDKPLSLRLPFVGLPFNAAIAGIAVVALVLALNLPLQRYQSLTQAYESTVSDLKQQAVEAVEAAEDEAAELERRSFLEERQAAYVSPLDVLADLTEALPDDAWLSSLQIRPTLIELQGEAVAASGLLERITDVERIHGVEFRSPVSRSSLTGREQFAITARLGAASQ